MRELGSPLRRAGRLLAPINLSIITLVLLLSIVCLLVNGEDSNKDFNVFRALSYEDMNAAILDLGARHPSSVKVSVAQEELGLPSPGLCGANRTLPCQTLIMRVTNFDTYEAEKETRPEIYISGALHGNERVGPHAALELARILVESDNPWVKRLLNTRLVVITPLTNSLGFDRNAREEGNIDPNRDYPIDQDPALCMRTITSRITNELFRNHLFQVAITFHGGMEAIAMEWGTLSRLKKNLHKSPDDFALMQLAGGLSKFAGSVNPFGRNYPVGRMNDLVYPVEGGMEDWAYAGNWDPLSRRQPCDPATFGKYPTSKTTYTDDMLRTVNILVETSNEKWPREFGTRSRILNPNSGTGHVPRNVRLALMLLDLAQPYIVWTFTETTKKTITVKWEVGGAFEVDKTYVTLQHKVTGQILATSPSLKGKTRWGIGTYGNREKWPFKSQFAACFSLDGNNLVKYAQDEFVLVAHAKVDSAWATQNDRSLVSPKGFDPQTHWVNARTNPNWKRSNAGRTVIGQTLWTSKSIEVQFLNVDKATSRGLKNWMGWSGSGKRLLRTIPRAQDFLVRSLEESENNESDDDGVEAPTCVMVGSELQESQSNESNARGDDSPQENFATGAVSLPLVFASVGGFLVVMGGIHVYRNRHLATHSRLPTEIPRGF